MSTTSSGATTHAGENVLARHLRYKGVTRMGQTTACVDLPCDWAQFLYTCAERGLEDGAIILIATWFREGQAMTQQFNLNHGHSDGDLLTNILAYQWFVETRTHYSQHYYNDWKIAWSKEWTACSKVGLMHHVMNAIYESVQVLSKAYNEHKEALPQVPKRQFGCPGYSTLLSHSVWTAFYTHVSLVHRLES